MSPIPTKEVRTTPTLMDAAEEPRETQALQAQAGGELAAMFDRFLSDPNASVEKIERLMALWERNEARKAEAAFNAAMSAAQAEMEPVRKDAWNPQTKSKYASEEVLDRALRPIYTKHGFGLSYDTGEAKTDEVLVLCYVTHAGGHQRTYRVLMPADGKGAKGGDVMTRTHATGSGMSYGKRYLLKLIFNVATGDDDGNKASAAARKPDAAKVPDGYDDWLANLAAVADEGWERFGRTWNDSRKDYRSHLVNTNPKELEQIRAKAKGVSRA